MTWRGRVEYLRLPGAFVAEEKRWFETAAGARGAASPRRAIARGAIARGARGGRARARGRRAGRRAGGAFAGSRSGRTAAFPRATASRRASGERRRRKCDETPRRGRTHLDVARGLDVLARGGGPGGGGGTARFVSERALRGARGSSARGALGRVPGGARAENRVALALAGRDPGVKISAFARPETRARDALELGAGASELVGGERGSHDD